LPAEGGSPWGYLIIAAGVFQSIRLYITGLLWIDVIHFGPILKRHLITKTRFIATKYEALHRTPYGGNPKFSAVLGTPSGGHLTVETISNFKNPNFLHRMPYGKNKNAYGCQKTVLNFGNLDFEFASDFDIRISNLT